MIDWINNRYQINLQPEEINNVRDFSLMWNIFEGLVCQAWFTIDKFENTLKGRSFNIEDFQETLEYFSNRYTRDGDINGRFNQLKFRTNDKEALVKQVLLGQQNEVHQVVFALVIIIYRLRNNLFHGTKQIQTINQQEENFRIANSFLMKLLEYY